MSSDLVKASGFAAQSETPPETFDPRVENHPLFAKATRFDALWAAWERVRSNNGSAGGDGMSVERFGAAAADRISSLSDRLRSGRYRPGPSRRALVPKAAGGFRPLDIPPVIDRIAQGSVALVLQPLLDAEFEDSSFGYRPGRSVAQAVQRVASHRRNGFTHVVDGDIVKYFERVPHAALLERLERSVSDERILDFVALMLECSAAHGVGLPQGSPLSPLLANLFLDDVDEAIEARGVRLVRFADDFVLMCRDEMAAKGAMERMRALLGERGLDLHAEKTRIVPFDKGFRFLGHLFVRSMVWREVFADDTPNEDLVAAGERAMQAARDADLVPSASEEPEEAQPARGRYAARQRLLYVLEPGRSLDADDEAFHVIDGEARLITLPHRRVDRIEVGLRASITMAALELAAATDTELVRIDGFGQETGRWAGPTDAGRATRHLAQAALISDPERRRVLAQILAAGRVFNQRTFLQRANRSRRDVEIAATIVKLNRCHRKLDRKPMPIEEAMGEEGAAAALYWPALRRLAGESWIFGGRRSRRIGTDPFNIVLDVLSGFLTRDMRTAAVRIGLHPGFGVLHSVRDGADALVFDLIEEFRAPLVEANAVAVFARGALDRSSFVQSDDGLWRLSREGWQACVRGWEAAAARTIVSPATGLATTWRGLMDDHALAYAAHVEGKSTYKPYRMDF